MLEPVLWLARTGNQWRELPARHWLWLRRVARAHAGRDRQPWLLMLVTQWVKGCRAGGELREDEPADLPRVIMVMVYRDYRSLAHRPASRCGAGCRAVPAPVETGR